MWEGRIDTAYLETKQNYRTGCPVTDGLELEVCGQRQGCENPEGWTEAEAGDASFLISLLFLDGTGFPTLLPACVCCWDKSLCEPGALAEWLACRVNQRT